MPWVRQTFLTITSKAWSIKEQIDKLDFIKTMKSTSPKDIVKRKKSKPETGRKYLMAMHLLKDLFS